jgi:hypothetical protein
MKNKQNFGELSAKNIEIGDIVEWTTWNFKIEGWDSHFGVVFEIKNKIVGNRLVSVSRIMPMTGDHTEIECFTMNLRTISRSENHNNE